METASAVYVQIKHQLLWASAPLLTYGWNIRREKGQPWEREWNRFRPESWARPLRDPVTRARLFDFLSEFSSCWSVESRHPPVNGPSPTVAKVIKSNRAQLFDLVLRLSSKGALEQSTKVLLSSPGSLWVLSTRKQRSHSKKITAKDVINLSSKSGFYSPLWYAMSVIPSLRECGISMKYLECICFLFVCVGAETLAEPLARLFEAIWRARSRGRNPARLSLASRPACPDDGNPWDSVSRCIVGSDSSRGRWGKQRAPSSCQINPTTSKGLTTTQGLSKVHHSALPGSQVSFLGGRI